MKQTTKHMIAAVLFSLPIALSAQTENPRGIYRMTTLTGNLGEVKAPYEQYKICTDSVTLMMSMHGSSFSISDNDNKVFNYTGSQPKDENDRGPLIYDSNADHFTLKWWSEYSGHIHFPKHDWCIEKYEAGKYTENARMVFDALNAVPTVGKANTLTSTWRVIGWMDELKGAKKQLAVLKANYATSKYVGQYICITNDAMVMTSIGRRWARGGVKKCECPNKNTLKTGKETCAVKWLSKDIIALEVRNDFRIDWQILERVADGQTLMGRIASLNQ